MLRFVGGAGRKALRKLNLTIKQLYKIRELDLLSEGKALLLSQEFCILWSQKNRSFTFFAFVISFESYV